MKLRAVGALLFVLVQLAMCACERTSFKGDGILVDKGRSEAHFRFQLDLGEIDLNKKAAYHYEFQGLPRKEFVLGVLVITQGPITSEYVTIKPITSGINLSLISRNRSVVKARTRLDEMTWSYGVGSSEIFIYGSDNKQTYFNSSPEQAYTLDLSISPPVRAIKINDGIAVTVDGSAPAATLPASCSPSPRSGTR